jgi:hypothetical protein
MNCVLLYESIYRLHLGECPAVECSYFKHWVVGVFHVNIVFTRFDVSLGSLANYPFYSVIITPTLLLMFQYIYMLSA